MYSKVFETLAAEDIEYMDGEDDFENIPHFGKSQSSFEEVINFYAHWESYTTKKSYAWLFTHNINEIRDRRVLKLVDKEHKKIQQKARKERNEEIRSLVQFVKKRDKRMMEYRKMLEEKAQQNRIKSQQNRLDTIRKRNELIKEQQQNSKVTSEHEEQLKQLEESYFNQYTDSENTEDECEDVQEVGDNGEDLESTFDDELYCVACNKFFNSESSKQNHEASKKHKQNVELLRSEMVDEEEKYKENCAVEETLAELDIEGENEDEHDQSEPEIKSKGKKSKKKNKKFPVTSSGLEAEDKASDSEDKDQSQLNLVHSDDDDWTSGKKSAKKSKSKPAKTKTEKSKVLQPETKTEPEVLKPVEADENETPDVSDLSCATCKEKFPSKNKLFNHLKKTNHSIYLGENKARTGEKLPSKKKK